jgi:hypothetical protein
MVLFLPAPGVTANEEKGGWHLARINSQNHKPP